MIPPVDASQPALTGRRILIVEEALKTTTGHFFEYDRAVKETSEANGAEVVVAGHVGMDNGVQSALGALAAFQRTCWEIGFSQMGPLRRQLEIIRHNMMFYRTVLRLIKRHGPFDIVFAPTVTIYHAPAIAILARTIPKTAARRFVSFFRNSMGVKAASGAWRIDPLKGWIWRRVFQSLDRSANRGRSTQVTDSQRLAEEYEILTGSVLSVLPHPAMTVRELIPLRDASTKPFTFGHLGPPRQEKGVDVLLSGISLFLEKRPDAAVRFVIQWNQAMIGDDGRAVEPDMALIADQRVIFIRDRLDSDQYMAWLNEIDCMVLPYRKAAYASRISGIAVEAATAGQCLIVTEDTWLSDLTSDHGHGIAIPDENPDALSDALVETYDNRITMAAKSRERSRQARSFHSNERFNSLLWGTL